MGFGFFFENLVEVFFLINVFFRIINILYKRMVEDVFLLNGF